MQGCSLSHEADRGIKDSCEQGGLLDSEVLRSGAVSSLCWPFWAKSKTENASEEP